MVVVLGLAMGMAGSTWRTVVQRAKEKQLLWVGNQYRQAIKSYYQTAHAGVKASYPPNLDALLRDPRSVGLVRHIRKLYKDPMTGKDFELIRAGGKVSGLSGVSGATGGIMGVRSTSHAEPFKKDGFSQENADFAKAKSYSDWKFVYEPNLAPPQPPSGQPPGNVPAAGQNPSGGNSSPQSENPFGQGGRSL